jgi:hypothetical protein
MEDFVTSQHMMPVSESDFKSIISYNSHTVFKKQIFISLLLSKIRTSFDANLYDVRGVSLIERIDKLK